MSGDPDGGSVDLISIDWGDGNGTTDYYNGLDYTFYDEYSNVFLGHEYADQAPSGTYYATITLTDDDYETSDPIYMDVLVANYPPTASIGNSGPINEGGTVTVSLTNGNDLGSDDMGAGLHYSFATSLGGLAGSYSSAGTTSSAAFALDDDGNTTLFARVQDKDDGYTDYSTVVTVANVAPFATLAFSDPDSSGNVTVSLTNVTDPSSADTSAGFKYSFNTDYDSLAGNYASASSSSSQVFSEASLANGAIVFSRVFDPTGPRNYQIGVTDMSAQVVSSSQINLTWTDDVTNELGWRVQWSDDGSFGTGHVWYQNIAAGLDHYEAIDVPDGTRRWFRVRAYGDGTHPGESVYSPKMADTTLLPAPDNLVAANLKNSSSDMDIEVSWDIMSQNQTGFTLKRFAAGVDVGTASPLETQNLGASASDYTFEGYEPGDLFQFTIQAVGTYNTSVVPPVFENRTLHPGSWLDVYDGSANEDYFVEATWTEPMIDPVDGPYYGAQEVEFTLSNLPQHTYASVAIGLDLGEDTEAPAPTAYADDTPLRMYEEDGYWLIELAPGGAGLPDAFEHTASDMTITIDMSEQDEELRWHITSADVQVYFPLVAFTDAVDLAVTEGDSGRITVQRVGASGTVTEDPMAIDLVDLGGTASGGDVNWPSTITIPVGAFYHTAYYDSIEDTIPEWTEDRRWGIPKRQSKYSRGDESLVETYEHVFDRHLEVVDDDLHISDIPEWLYLNDDDDDSNSTLDMDEGTPAAPDYLQELNVDGEDDLYPIYFDTPEEEKAGAHISLSGPNDKIRIWENQDRSGILYIGENRASITWVVGEDEVPELGWVEVYAASETTGDIVVGLAGNDGFAEDPPEHQTSTTAQSQPSTTATKPGVWVEYLSDATEGTGSLQFIVRRVGGLDQTLTVNLGTEGTAVSGTDYNALPTSVTFPVNQDSVTISATTIQDTLMEFSEPVILTITTDSAYTILPYRQNAAAVAASPSLRQRYKLGKAKGFLDDDESGPRAGHTYPTPAAMNSLAADTTDKDAWFSVRCFQWAFNVAGNPLDFDSMVTAAHNCSILWDTGANAEGMLDEAIVDAPMMKRVTEARLYDTGGSNILQGYRTPANAAPPSGWHMIAAYWRAAPDFHFATLDFDPAPGVNTWGGWSMKEGGLHDAENVANINTVPGTLIGTYMVATPPRDSRATP